ncbi:C2 domain-containing protein [Infundibulicybe gibba]|nr:C2 domain-containing protein [Infundibulicybe gibba]
MSLPQRSTQHNVPIGAIRVTVQSSQIIPWSKLLGGSPDPFIAISIDSGDEIVRTSAKNHCFDPTWMETHYIPVNTLNASLKLTLYNHHAHWKHTFLGAARFNLSKLQGDPALGGISARLSKDQKERGEVLFDLAFYPIVPPGSEPTNAYFSGILTLYIRRAENLQPSEDMGELNPAAEIRLGVGDKPIHSTQRVAKTANPLWQSTCSFFCVDKSCCTIHVTVTNDGRASPVIGQLSIRLEDLLEGLDTGVDSWSLSGCRRGKLVLGAIWGPLNLP